MRRKKLWIVQGCMGWKALELTIVDEMEQFTALAERHIAASVPKGLSAVQNNLLCTLVECTGLKIDSRFQSGNAIRCMRRCESCLVAEQANSRILK